MCVCLFVCVFVCVFGRVLKLWLQGTSDAALRAFALKFGEELQKFNLQRCISYDLFFLG